jgi:hypothetical protein
VAVDRLRLLDEQREMEVFARHYPSLSTFHLYEDTDYRKDDWGKYLWEGQAPTGHKITARYSSSHPLRQMSIVVDPKLNTHHYLGESICYLKNGEWHAGWTAATAILTAFRFLSEYLKGEMT